VEGNNRGSGGGGSRRGRLGFLMDQFGAGQKKRRVVGLVGKGGHALLVLVQRRRNRAASLL
jgi:hypothetical protein